MAETRAPTPKSPRPKASPWESLTPEQLLHLSKGYRKAGMKELENKPERERLFRQANLLRGATKLKAKRLAKGKSAEPNGSSTPNPLNKAPTSD